MMFIFVSYIVVNSKLCWNQV